MASLGHRRRSPKTQEQSPLSPVVSSWEQINRQSRRTRPQATDSLRRAQHNNRNKKRFLLPDLLLLTCLCICKWSYCWLMSQSPKTRKRRGTTERLASKYKISSFNLTVMTSSSHSGEKQWDGLWDLAARKSVWAGGFVFFFFVFLVVLFGKLHISHSFPRLAFSYWLKAIKISLQAGAALANSSLRKWRQRTVLLV